MSEKKKAALLLLPNLLGPHKHHQAYLPASVDKAVASLDGLIAESEGGGRRFLRHFELDRRPEDIPLALCNKHSKKDDFDFLLEPIREGERWGIISDAGLPCVADPGAKLVKRARQTGIAIQAFQGPSSITLALMLSGLTGQQFCFHGYLPRESQVRQQRVRLLEKRSRQEKATQIFIEAPHRNDELLKELLDTLDERTMLCAAWDLTMSGQGVLSQPVATWKKSPLPNLHKKPTVFLFGSA